MHQHHLTTLLYLLLLLHQGFGSKLRYLVGTGENFVNLLQIDGESFENAIIYLINDIELPSGATLPFGSSTTPFRGTFDGNNFTIVMRNTIGGLFTKMDNAVIRNVKIDQISGPVCIEAQGNTTFEGVHTVSNINSGSEPRGSLVGNFSSENGRLTIKDCTAKAATVQSGTKYYGGLVGYAEGPVIISNAVVDYTLSLLYPGELAIGGLVGAAVSLVVEQANVTMHTSVQKPQLAVAGGICGNCLEKNGSCIVDGSFVTWYGGEMMPQTCYGGVIGFAIAPVHITNTRVVGDNLKAQLVSGFVGVSMQVIIKTPVEVMESLLEGTFHSGNAMYGVTNAASKVKNVIVAADFQCDVPDEVYIIAKTCKQCSCNYASKNLFVIGKDYLNVSFVEGTPGNYVIYPPDECRESTSSQSSMKSELNSSSVHESVSQSEIESSSASSSCFQSMSTSSSEQDSMSTSSSNVPQSSGESQSSSASKQSNVPQSSDGSQLSNVSQPADVSLPSYNNVPGHSTKHLPTWLLLISIVVSHLWNATH